MLQPKSYDFHLLSQKKRTGLGPHPGKRKTKQVAVPKRSAKENSKHYSFESLGIGTPETYNSRLKKRTGLGPHPILEQTRFWPLFRGMSGVLNLDPVLIYICAFKCEHRSRRPSFRTGRSQEPMVDPVCQADSYLIQKTSCIGLRPSWLEIKWKAMPKQPSPRYDRLFAILARGADPMRIGCKRHDRRRSSSTRTNSLPFRVPRLSRGSMASSR
jgi:hypothetical protein